MSLKKAFAAVLKAMRAGRGLTQRNLAEVSSRTYVSKLERWICPYKTGHQLPVKLMQLPSA